MAHNRQRGDRWEYIVKKSGVLGKPLSLTFDSEAAGDAYVARLEALLDRGIVPQEQRVRLGVPTLSVLIKDYLSAGQVKPKTVDVLQVLD
ncbi:MAG: hypothetical protein OHK0048_20900 [Rhodoferax sp.]